MTSKAKKDMVIRWNARGVASPEETARLLGIPLPEVHAILKESMTRHPSVRTTDPEFIEPPLFE
ncbi:hypothetical protein BW13_00855 [Bifidobacterium sp. UTCIF-37]|uniref:hypothetical protein n=1 Tax=unclassified Bifidobacterium TaxID=2608897 RepID=UPI00112B6A23|nr:MULTISPECIES: hypothetical protein [unclassified Bifidobacterium]TPF87433.1 hypothetical protein BW13_00855 [Bifidobacterium sp. UTCIF-37]TPF91209.1 hypothetical protein BW11_00855 [Bifidobacterium sp. UTCIF-38]